MQSYISLIIGALICSTIGTDNIQQGDSELVLKADQSHRLSRTVEGERLIELTDLVPGNNYLLHISAQGGMQNQIRHSGIGKSHRVLKDFTTADLPLSIDIEARSTTAWIRLHTPGEEKLSFSLLRTTAKQKKSRAEGIEIQAGISAENLIRNYLLGGDCFDVSNIQPVGPSEGRAQFSNGGEALGIGNGIMFSTGVASLFTGPNISTNTTNVLDSEGDPDLSVIAGAETFDAVGIEFDFTPTVEEVTFKYVFASEEYCEYVGSMFNDDFGFFLSGPGIDGPFSSDAINLARIPGSGEPVSINTLNYSENASYYINNAPHSSGGTGGCVSGEIDAGGEVLNLIEFDGLTIPLEANVQVQACQTYHIKLVVADASDGIWDSGVFLKQNSFQAGGQARIDAENTVTEENFTYEQNCLPAQAVFTREGGGVPLNEPLTLDLLIDSASTATEGEDFKPLPDSITIPADQDSVVIPIEVLDDDITEGEERIILEFDFVCECENPETTFFIRELTPLQATGADTTVCRGEAVQLKPSASGGYTQIEYEYAWSNGDNTQQISVSPEESTTYTVTVTDFCGDTAVSSFSVDVLTPPTAEIEEAGSLSCLDSTVTLDGSNSSSGPNISYQWTDDEGEIIGNDDTVSVDEMGTYELEVINKVAGCSSTSEVSVNGFDQPPVAYYLFEQDDLHIKLEDLSTEQPVEWFWNFGDGSTSTEQNPEHLYSSPGNYLLCLTVSNDCGSATYCRTIRFKVGRVPESDQVPCTCPPGGSRLAPDEDADFNQWDMYPNPVTSSLHVQGSMDRKNSVKIQLMDVNGRILRRLEQTTKKLDVNIDMSALPPGVYYIGMKSGHSSVVRPVVKQ